MADLKGSPTGQRVIATVSSVACYCDFIQATTTYILLAAHAPAVIVACCIALSSLTAKSPHSCTVVQVPCVCQLSLSRMHTRHQRHMVTIHTHSFGARAKVIRHGLICVATPCTSNDIVILVTHVSLSDMLGALSRPALTRAGSPKDVCTSDTLVQC
jgi:hypothetical protein